MSWSFLDARHMNFGKWPLCARGSLVLLVALYCGRPAGAAEVYWQPVVSLLAEENSNLELAPGNRQYTEGYLADLSTTVGIATPDSNTLFRPRVQYDYYPQNPLDDKWQAYLDLNSSFHTQRSSGSITGSFIRVDEFNAELNSAVFNDINPVQPTNPETGKVTTGTVQDNLILRPTYSYRLTPIISAGVSGVYQLVNYSPSVDLDHSDFDYYQGRAFMNWSVSQKSDLTIGAIGSKFQATHVDSDATGRGATADLDTNWTPIISTHASLIYLRTTINNPEANFAGVIGAWGGSISGLYKTQASRFRITAGRKITPSGAGAIYDVDTLQFQYDRDLSARFTFTGAVLGLRTHELEESFNNVNRTYTQEVLQAKWMMTRFWFLQGGYQYQWQKFVADTASGMNNRLFIQVGYQGLQRE